MTINSVSSNIATRQIQTIAAKAENFKAVQNTSGQTSAFSPLSSRYTYAMGSDGKRYILQLRIDIASASFTSALNVLA